MKSANDEWKCNKCEKQFASSYSYQRHLNRKTPCDEDKEQKEYVCDKCGKVFQRRDRLQSHLNRKVPCVQEVTNSNLKCQYCNNEYSTVSNKNKHEKICSEKEKVPLVLLNKLNEMQKQIEVLTKQQAANVTNVTNIQNNVTINMYTENVVFSEIAYENLKKIWNHDPDARPIPSMITSHYGQTNNKCVRLISDNEVQLFMGNDNWKNQPLPDFSKVVTKSMKNVVFENGRPSYDFIRHFPSSSDCDKMGKFIDGVKNKDGDTVAEIHDIRDALKKLPE